MASLLKGLSAILLTAGVVGGAYLLVETRKPELLGANAFKLRPALDEAVDQGKVAVRTLFESAQAAQRSVSKPEIDAAKLPFIVIEPRDFAAPTFKLPPRRHAPAPQAQTEEPPPEVELARAPTRLPLDLEPVEARLRARLPAELIGYFDLFLYVSKAKKEKGDWGQRMFVLAKEDQQLFRLLHDWPVSTGLEEVIPSPSGAMLGTDTPQGAFKLDRGRFHKDYTSRQWQSPMPHAMFFDWQIQGRTSGLAIHGTDDVGVKQLGERASHGCIRLAPENAQTLFELIQTKYRGRVPVFQVNPDSGTMSTAGALVRDEEGKVKMTYGYKVLVFIEDYGGPSIDTVAALY
jgi:hypothetical protein